MSLSSALSTAQSILSNTSTQTSLISRNISNVGNPNYVRREGQLATNQWGAQIVNISRASNAVLYKNSLESLSASAGQTALLDGIDQIRALLGGNDYETSPSALIGAFRDSLQLFASLPGDTSAAQDAVAQAVTVADSIREQSLALQKLRLETDAEIGREVENLNKLLADFEKVNNEVIKATRTGRDASDWLDERERLLRGISEIVGITTVTRDSNDVAIYTKDGATLFETVPREVSFARTNGFDASITGNPILIDGVPLAAGSGGATTAQGSLAALLQVRDDAAPKMQAQLDEIARGLITAFAESDPSGVQPDRPGLFTWSGGATLTSGTIEPGLASSLQVSNAYRTNPFLLRDGGANGAAYVHNTEGGSGFAELLNSLVGGIEEPMTFDVTADAGTEETLLGYAANSVGWLEALRQQAESSAETKEAAHFRNDQALSNASGVNIDEEMSKLLELEQSYQASARIIAAVDEMIDTLLGAV